jgi:hypothetical protein
MPATFRFLANIDFCASHQPLSLSGLPSVADSSNRALNGGFLFVQTQPSMLFSRAALLQFVSRRGLNRLRSIASHRLTLRSSGLSKNYAFAIR